MKVSVKKIRKVLDKKTGLVSKLDYLVGLGILNADEACAMTCTAFINSRIARSYVPFESKNGTSEPNQLSDLTEAEEDMLLEKVAEPDESSDSISADEWLESVHGDEECECDECANSTPIFCSKFDIGGLFFEVCVHYHESGLSDDEKPEHAPCGNTNNKLCIVECAIFNPDGTKRNVTCMCERYTNIWHTEIPVMNLISTMLYIRNDNRLARDLSNMPYMYESGNGKSSVITNAGLHMAVAITIISAMFSVENVSWLEIISNTDKYAAAVTVIIKKAFDIAYESLHIASCIECAEECDC